MLEADIKAATAGLSLGEAILVILTTPELHTDYDGCTLGGLDQKLHHLYEGDVYLEVLALIAARKAYMAVPISLADPDCYVMPVHWTVGTSKLADVTRHFGSPHGVTARAGGQIVTYDLYVANVDDPDEYPSPPAPYAVRDAESEGRLMDCDFPFTGTWPPEALQVEFSFDQSDVLASYDFIVGRRLT